jgi:hypothetical protein
VEGAEPPKQTQSGANEPEVATHSADEPQESPSGKPSRPPQPDLLFVTYTGPSDLESRDIKDVRSHVMKQHVRRRRTRTKESEAGEQALTEVKRPRIKLLPGAGRVDPFGTLSVTMIKAMSRLFDHCKRPYQPGFPSQMLPETQATSEVTPFSNNNYMITNH